MAILGIILHNDENPYRIVISKLVEETEWVFTGPGVEEEGVWIVWGGST